ncbi:jg19530 [Pararge aegeria aegeria]|uniref:Jg19530 protein n=1 Tax=Pararge aegeria aegeria TaxID=348720 RepID=A0A8S4R5Q1_9NEOP|nr:jg19530 [Pararge aegeria aegeria]
MQRAADAVIKDGRKLRTVARELGICHMTLFRYVKKIKDGVKPTVGYYSRQVFHLDRERALAEYLSNYSSIFFGLLKEEIKKLAYNYAVKLNMPNIPVSWHKNKEAGTDWLMGFLKRNSCLCIRTPEASSAGRASAFNRNNVHEFFTKLQFVLLKNNLHPSRIWNLDETEVTTVLKPKKVMEGVKQEGAIISPKRGTFVTVELAASAAGNTIPPMFVFPNHNYKDLLILDGPPKSIGAGNSSGSMTATEFLIYMNHFIEHTKPTPEDPVLLLLDNNSAHVDIDVVEKAKANSIIMLSFPQHCSQNLQPLDVSVNGPFITYCAEAQENWLNNNPGKSMSIYEIPGIVRHAWPLSSTPDNITNAFKKVGISPFDPDIFKDEDYTPCLVTEFPMSHTYTRGESDQNQPHDDPLLLETEVKEPHIEHLKEESNIFAEVKARKQKVYSKIREKGTGKKKGLCKGIEKFKSISIDSRELLKQRVLQYDDPGSDDENLEWFCIICCGSYSNSLPRAQWIECVLCKNWAHLKCLDSNDGVHSYVYPNNSSDDDAFE